MFKLNGGICGVCGADTVCYIAGVWLPDVCYPCWRGADEELAED